MLGEIEAAGLIENAAVIGAELRAVILGLGSPLITEVRGQGALVGIGLSRPIANELAAAALAEGLIINAPNDSTLRLAPPLIIGDSEIEEFRTIFARALAAQATEVNTLESSP